MDRKKDKPIIEILLALVILLAMFTNPEEAVAIVIGGFALFLSAWIIGKLIERTVR